MFWFIAHVKCFLRWGGKMICLPPLDFRRRGKCPRCPPESAATEWHSSCFICMAVVKHLLEEAATHDGARIATTH